MKSSRGLPNSFCGLGTVRLRNALAGGVAAVALSALAVPSILAADLTIAKAADISSFDPHYHNTVTNNAMVANVFEALLGQDENQNLVPLLSTSWEAIDDTTWEFKLREGVEFQDGTPFTAADVVYSLQRIGDVPNSPSRFTSFTGTIDTVEAVDDLTVRVHTKGPDPILPRNLSMIYIVSEALSQDASTADFNDGSAAVGTGPYKFVSWRPGEQVELERNATYWGGEAAWDRVVMRIITEPSSRVAALLSGGVQAIEQVPPDDIAGIRERPAFKLFTAESTSGILYLHLDSDRTESPMVQGPDGGQIENPLRNANVRKAISYAIDRSAIVDRLLEGLGTPASQLIPATLPGYNAELDPVVYDPEQSMALLSDAGYADGFRVTLAATAGRYVNDEAIAQAVAQMLTRVGITIAVETMPASVLFSRGSNLEFSMLQAGAATLTGDAAEPLRALLQTFDPDLGTGPGNRGRYSNEEFDALMNSAAVEMDPEVRSKLLSDAAGIAYGEDFGLIPVLIPLNAWAVEASLNFTPRVNGYTMAEDFRPAE